MILSASNRTGPLNNSVIALRVSCYLSIYGVRTGRLRGGFVS